MANSLWIKVWEECVKATIRRAWSTPMPCLLWHQKTSQTRPRQIRNVCKHRCGFLTPKRGPKPHPNHGRRQPDWPPWGIDDKNCRHHNVKTPLEQNVEHTTGKIHVHRLEEFLPFCAAREVWIHAHPYWTVSNMDHRTIWPIAQGCQRTYLPRNETCGMGTPPSRYIGQQTTVQMSCSQQILRIQANAGTMATHHTPQFLHPGGGQLWREIHK